LWLSGRPVEKEPTENWDGASYEVPAKGFQGKSPLDFMESIMSLNNAYKRCLRLMKQDKPDVLLAMGSYASVGPIRAALKLKIPVVLHEANVIPGRAISFFAKRATSVAACFEESRHYLSKVDITITGIPLRKEIEDIARQPRSHQDDERFTILCMGGSLGSKVLNQHMGYAASRLVELHPGVEIIHLTGTAHEKEMRQFYEDNGVENISVYPFYNNMAELYKRTDLAVCRAGAATCNELLAFAVPALLVPYPYASRDHQTFNAEAMEKIGSADFVPESDLIPSWLAEYLDGCMNTPNRLERMKKAAMNKRMLNASVLLADEIERVGLGADRVKDRS